MTTDTPGTPGSPLPPSTPYSDPWVLYRLSWGSIFAGAFVAFALHLLLTILGISFGFMMSPDLRAEHPAGITAAAGIGWTLTTVVSLWLGGWLAGRTAGHGHGNVGGLHGITVWGLVATASYFIIWRHIHGWRGPADMDESARRSVAALASWAFLTLAAGAFAAGWGGRCGAMRGVSFRRMM